METIGKILKNAREKKGLTIDELESTTHIVAKFIKALEDEDFDALPGEIYVKGFIKNLSDKLSLDSDMVLDRYNLQKNSPKFEEDMIRSSRFARITKKDPKVVASEKGNASKSLYPDAKTPNPDVKTVVDKTLDKEEEVAKTVNNKAKSKKDSNKNIVNPIGNAEADLLLMARRDLNKLRRTRNIPFVPIIIVLAIIVVIAVIFVNKDNIAELFSRNNKREDIEIARNIVNSTSKQNVKRGDIIYFKPLGVSATIKFNSIGNVINLNINGEDLSFSKNNPIMMDLNGNGINDFRISIVEVYDDLATVEIEKLEENQMINNDYSTNNIQSNLTGQVPTAEDNLIYNTPLISTNLPIINGETYIEQDTEKSSIRVEITAKHFVYVRYFIDSDGPATINLLSGKTINLEARDVIMLTVGNAGEVVVKVNGRVISVGGAGDTVNKTIKWVKNLNDSTRYNLIMSDTK